jgi:hypothetical protein
MIDVKAAVQVARSYAMEVLGEFKPTVEEIDREEYKARDVWKITLGFPSDVYHAGRASPGLPSKEYKSFLIDAETGQPLAMKIRELTS